MRWTRWCRSACAQTNDTDADAKACGPGLPTLRSSRAVTSRAMTGAIKPGPRGERAISVKTIAQGMPDDLAEPVVTAACLLFCRRAMGCGQHPAFPAPSSMSRAVRFKDSDASAPRECEAVSLRCHAPLYAGHPVFRGGCA